MKTTSYIFSVLFFFLLTYSYGNESTSGLIFFSDNNEHMGTDLVLVKKEDSTYILMSYGGYSPQSAVCAIKSTGNIANSKITGWLVDVNTDVVSYKIGPNLKIPFSALLTDTILEVIDANVEDFCGLNASFIKRYFKVAGKKILGERIRKFENFLQGSQENMDVLVALQGFNSGLNSKQNSSTNLDAIHLQALALYKKKMKNEAAELLFKAIGTKPWIINSANIIIFNDCAYLLVQASQYQDAIDVLTQVITAFPDRTVAYLNLGDAQKGASNTTEAKKNYKAYIDLMEKAGKKSKIPQRVIDFLK